MDTKVAKPAARRTRRRHAAEFKAQVIEACLQPGVSVAGVALANDLNANHPRRWVTSRIIVSKHREAMWIGWTHAMCLRSLSGRIPGEAVFHMAA